VTSAGRQPRRVALVTPAARGTRHGNRITALRWARLLRQLGASPFVCEQWQGRDADVMLAVHARRSSQSVIAFRRAHPGRGIAVLLSGTDIYPVFDFDPLMRRCLQAADRLVVLQPLGRDVLPAELQHKVRVIRQSAVTGGRTERSQRQAGMPLHALVLAHLRSVKDPGLACTAAAAYRGVGELQVTIAGKVMEQAVRHELSQVDSPRCHYIGELTHAEAMQQLAASDLLVVTSRGEGGANVVSEALALGVPVLATRIDGNTGILGEDWPGLFPVGDAPALARLLERAADEPDFLALLRSRTVELQPLVAPEAEREALAALLAELD
jgi:putative glycosyltransferase (TIGR04348 family)